MKIRFLTMLIAILGVFPTLAAARFPGLPMSGFSVGGTGLTPFYVLGFELGPWQSYLARQLTPNYLVDPTARPLRISWLDQKSVMILPMFAEKLFGEPQTYLKFQVDWQRSNDLGMNHFDQDVLTPGSGFERKLVASSLLHSFNDAELVGVSAVFATQSFGGAQLGLHSYDQNIPVELRDSIYGAEQETGFGVGVQFSLRSEINDSLALNAGFQSRINMDKFATYRGVYAQPADLDIPARAKLGLALKASSQSWLNISVERVLFSDVGAFANRNLPGRFLSLLGDTTSPSFAWDDLTVYSVGWNWENRNGTSLHVDFSSRTQPSPSSKILSQAIDADLANNAMTLGFSRRTSMNSRLNVNAAYAPSEFAFGGNVLGVTSDRLNQDFEFEAYWTLDF